MHKSDVTTSADVTVAVVNVVVAVVVAAASGCTLMQWGPMRPVNPWGRW
jgi:hypothetical protein